MDVLDNQFTETPDSGGLKVNRNMRLNWLSTSKWAMFFAILGFILAGISLLTIGTIMPMMQSVMAMSGSFEAASMMQSIVPYAVGVMVVLTIALCFVHYFHLRFAQNIQRAMQFDDQATFESAWRNLRYNFRLTGIIVISYIVIYVVAIIFVVSFSASRSGI